MSRQDAPFEALELLRIREDIARTELDADSSEVGAAAPVHGRELASLLRAAFLAGMAEASDGADRGDAEKEAAWEKSIMAREARALAGLEPTPSEGEA